MFVDIEHSAPPAAPLGAGCAVSLRWSESGSLNSYYKHFAPNGAKKSVIHSRQISLNLTLSHKSVSDTAATSGTARPK